VVLLKEYQKQL
jgi:hypothetical protein